MLQVVELDELPSYPELLCRLANLTPPHEDFEIILRSRLLPESYQSTPSMLAKKALLRHSNQSPPTEFESYSTKTLSPTHVQITFHRNRQQGQRHLNAPADTLSFVARVKRWLHDDDDLEPTLDIPLSHISQSFQIRPEQAAYRIYRETGIRIQIKRLKTLFRITKK